jgi:hypothetical protein
MADTTRAVWRKSSRSSSDGQCVEFADLGDTIGVRDSKDPTGPALAFSPVGWTEFLASVKTGKLDR